MKKTIQYIIRTLIFLTVVVAWGQDKEVVNGKVSFITANSVYVRFDSTAAIQVGDTLRLDGQKGPACLFVDSKSTTSCVCLPLFDCKVEKGDKIIFIPPVKTDASVAEEIVVPRTLRDTLDQETKELAYPQEIKARISASTYSLVSNDRENRHRLMSRLSVDADHIDDSRFSAQVYMNFRHILDAPTGRVGNNSLLRVFNFAVSHETTPTLKFLFGRAINPKISSLGPMDGLQAEKQLGNAYVGAMVGSRPDVFDFGFNPNLLQYGAYLGINSDRDDFRSQTTLGFIEQRGEGAIDRRYAYAQHTSALSQNLNLFASAEMDLYSKVGDTIANDYRLTSLYSSLRYRFSRGVSLMVSYDTRKRIIYYDTYRSDIEQLLDDDLARQGVRARINIRPLRRVFTGFSYSKRFQSDQQNKSDNIHGYLTLSQTPFVHGRTSVSYNQNQSNYVVSNIISMRHSRGLFENRLNTELYYRLAEYDYTMNFDKLSQQLMGVNLTYHINRTLMFSLTGELSMYNDSRNYRVYTRLVQRFHSKHKN
ncbi:hypothetical protein [Flagellimonas marinaquae]|uniref:hypothetical protein n=1 Tax=Flagellimonas marinaquae TaxID=254955 RepID=UPI000F8D98DF|nr:hypothetical protein [Allomuricauda aquimarina]